MTKDAKSNENFKNYNDAQQNYNSAKEKLTPSNKEVSTLDMNDTTPKNDVEKKVEKKVNEALKKISKKDPSLNEYFTDNKNQFENYIKNPDEYLNNLKNKITAGNALVDSGDIYINDLKKQAAVERPKNHPKGERTNSEKAVDPKEKYVKAIKDDQISSKTLLNNLNKYKAIESAPDINKTSKLSSMKQNLMKASKAITKVPSFISSKLKSTPDKGR